ncbi:tape measure protein [Panacagrimonas sp.]|uniref:tape measure protein n=1 Tax=Panacagrimonas sp. TaxID=2480088 RepID=UPI003B517F41
MAAYAGADFLRGSVDTALQFEAIERALKAVTGSSTGAEEALRFIRAEAERLGLPLLTSADGFKRLAASAKDSGTDFQTVKNLYTALSESAAALALDQNQLQRIFLAFGQMMSKGKVQAEELRGQLGESLPGAFSLAAKAMDVTTGELDKMLERGELTAEMLITRLIPVLRQEFGAAASEATGSALASFNRLQTALTELKLEFAESGLLDDLSDSAGLLTEKFKDPEFVNSIRTLGQTVGSLAAFMAEHGGTLLRIVVGLQTAKLGAGIGTALGALGGPGGAVIGRVAGAAIGGIGGYAAAGQFGSGDGDTGERAMPPRERIALLQQEAAKLAEHFAYLKAIGQEQTVYGQQALAGIKQRADEMRKLLGIREELDAPTKPGAASGSGSETGAQAAIKHQQDAAAHFAQMVDAEDQRLREQAELRRRLHLDNLRAEQGDSAAALAELRDEYDAHIAKLGDSADGADLVNRWFDRSEAAIALADIRSNAERELQAIQDRIAARDRRSEFADPAERRRLQDANALDAMASSGIIGAASAQGAPFGGSNDAAFGDFIRRSGAAVDDLARSIERATEGPMDQMFRAWRDGTLQMEQAGARWVEATVGGIAQMATKGKFDFRSLADAIIEDIIRVQLQSIAANLAGGAAGQFIGGLFGGRAGAVDFANQDPFGPVQYKAAGGYIAGPGGPTSDSILARLSNGEFVINAKAVKAFGRDTFEALNKGFTPGGSGAPKFSSGGYVGGGSGTRTTSAGTVVQIINQSGGPVREESRRAPDGTELRRIVIGAVREDVAQNGPLSRTLQRAYGLHNKPGVR